MSRHEIEALGMTKVVIDDGKVVEVGEPQVKYCPLFAKLHNIQEITPDIVRQNVEFRINDFGMCTPQRKLRMKDYLSFGVSELLGTSLSNGMLDAAVIVCEGAGTVVISEPDLVQGIGGRVSGLVKTTPIPEIVQALGEEKVLDPANCTVDQVKGAEKAFGMGFRRIGVTLCSADDARALRERYGQKVAIFAVHTTGRTEEESKELFRYSDIITACASKYVRIVAKDEAVMQVGNKVPIYAASLWGEMLLKQRLEQTKIQNKTSPEDPPRPLL